MSSQQFYRRKLPATCISFYSEEGKTIFKEALTTENMECYFKLASQFRTQDEPAFCGLTSLVIALNALEVDPGQVWKGPWRWYHEKMLNCCKSLEDIEKEGITFDVFVCLASCNYLDVQHTRVKKGKDLEDFRDTVTRMTKSDKSFIIVSYSRKPLQQTGDGHFSPIGGYHPERDLVLVLDTARFKYPPHWIPLPLLFEAMTAVDKSTGLPRGYVVLSRRNTAYDLLLFRLSDSISVLCKSAFPLGMKTFIENWEEWLTAENNHDAGDDAVIQCAVEQVCSLSESIKSDQYILTKQDEIKCPQDVQEHLKCSLDILMKQLEGTSVYSFAKSRDTISTLCGNEITFDIECDTTCKLTLNAHHFITVFLLSWPYTLYTHAETMTNAEVVRSHVENILSAGANDCLRSEIHALQKQFSNILQFRQSKLCA